MKLSHKNSIVVNLAKELYTTREALRIVNHELNKNHKLGVLPSSYVSGNREFAGVRKIIKEFIAKSDVDDMIMEILR